MAGILTFHTIFDSSSYPAEEFWHLPCRGFFASDGPRECPPRGIAAAAYAKNMPPACFLNAAVPRPGADPFLVGQKGAKKPLRTCGSKNSLLP